MELDVFGEDCSGGTDCRREWYWHDQRFCGWRVIGEGSRENCAPLINSYAAQLREMGMANANAVCPEDENTSTGTGENNSTGTESNLPVATVEFSVRSPDKMTLVSKQVSAPINEGVEFPAIGDLGSTVLDADVDVSADSVVFTYIETNTFATGSFNGYVLTFSHLYPPIRNVSLGESSFTPAENVWLSSTSTLYINVADLSATAGDVIRINFAR